MFSNTTNQAYPTKNEKMQNYRQSKETTIKFKPLETPLMSVSEAFEFVKVKYKDAFEFLKNR